MKTTFIDSNPQLDQVCFGKQRGKYHSKNNTRRQRNASNT